MGWNSNLTAASTLKYKSAFFAEVDRAASRHMTARLPNLLIFLFGLQFIVALLAANGPRTFACFHIFALLITLTYFAALVFGLPKIADYRCQPFERLFGHSILPFLQVVAADLWLAAQAFHVPNQTACLALIFSLSLLTLL
jgi:hypothetical protein